MSAPTKQAKQAVAAERQADAERAVEAWLTTTLAKAPPLNGQQADLIRRLLASRVRKRIAERGEPGAA